MRKETIKWKGDDAMVDSHSGWNEGMNGRRVAGGYKILSKSADHCEKIFFKWYGEEYNKKNII